MYHRFLSSLALLVALASCSTNLPRADYHVIPLPATIQPATNGAAFVLNASVKVTFPQGDADLERNAQFFTEWVQQQTGISMKTQAGEPSGKCIELKTDSNFAAEAFTISIGDQGIEVVGGSPAGVLFALQTIRKSLPVGQATKIALPEGVIKDNPRFGYRGMHLDVARHFFTVAEVKQYIDMLSLHNMNRFHWHLTDDQGWRIEMKKYPLLAQEGSKREQTVIGHNSPEFDGTPYGGFYTQEEIKEVIAYAADRYITIVPEIDLPGHMLGALTAYPELGCTGGPYKVSGLWGVFDDVLCPGKPETMTFIEDILNELMDLFPGELIHVGGDECPKTRWETCPDCQALIKKLGYKDDGKHTAEQYLQSYVISFAEKVINDRGRRLIGWDEILEGGLAPNATVMSWRGTAGGEEAALQHHDVIMTPNTYLYFDYYQSNDHENEPDAIGGYLPLERVYSMEPMPASLKPEEQKYIIGVQANLWTEYIPTFSQALYMALPRAAALSEVQWTAPELKDYTSFKARLIKLMKIYDVCGYNYARHIFDLSASIGTNPAEQAVIVTLTTADNAPIYYTLDGSEPTMEKGFLYEQPISLTNPGTLTAECTLNAAAFRDGQISGRIHSEHFSFTAATGKAITLTQQPHPNYTYQGATTLVDGVLGDRNYKTGRWLGFQGTDMEAVIDLGGERSISKVSFNTCVEWGDWIMDAQGLTVSISNDGTTYRQVFTETYPAPTFTRDTRPANGVFTHKAAFDAAQARYVKVLIRPQQALPSRHPGRGRPAFLFVDEISVE